MTREQLINEAVAKALGWENKVLEGFSYETNLIVLTETPYWITADRKYLYHLGKTGFTATQNMVSDYLFPHIEKLGLWKEYARFLLEDKQIAHTIAGYTRHASLATPLQICEAFLRATGNWTKEMA